MKRVLINDVYLLQLLLNLKKSIALASTKTASTHSIPVLMNYNVNVVRGYILMFESSTLIQKECISK